MRKESISAKDYPLRENRSEILKTPSGVNIEDITIDNIENGKVAASDCRTSKESLLLQADIAEDCGNHHISANFKRAAEMIDIDSDRIIEIYNALRPYRSTEKELYAIISELREIYNAEKTAEFVEDAVKVMKIRKQLKGDR